MNKLLLVGIGGFIGASLRYWFGGMVQEWSGSVTFPYGTLVVNLLGCLVIGFLSQLAEARSVFTPETRLLVFTGVLGGFTTFSTFGNETYTFLQDGENRLAFINLAVHVVIGLAMVWCGRALAHLIWR